MTDSPRWCDDCDGYGDHHTARHPVCTTKSGRVLTNEDIERLADEAERGYCVASVLPWTVRQPLAVP